MARQSENPWERRKKPDGTYTSFAVALLLAVGTASFNASATSKLKELAAFPDDPQAEALAASLQELLHISTIGFVAALLAVTLFGIAALSKASRNQ